MSLFSRRNPIMAIERDKFEKAAIYQCFFMFLAKPADKADQNYSYEVYRYIDIKYMNEKSKYVIVRYDRIGVDGYNKILIYQEDKPEADLSKALRGYNRHETDWYIHKAQLPEYRFNTPFYGRPMTAAGYFGSDRLYSGMTLDEFMSNGGDNLEEIFKAVQEDAFPQNMHARLKGRLRESWQKESYDELVDSLETKEFDISESPLHEHITKKQFKHFETCVLKEIPIKTINAGKRSLWGKE